MNTKANARSMSGAATILALSGALIALSAFDASAGGPRRARARRATAPPRFALGTALFQAPAPPVGHAPSLADIDPGSIVPMSPNIDPRIAVAMDPNIDQGIFPAGSHPVRVWAPTLLPRVCPSRADRAAPRPSPSG